MVGKTQYVQDSIAEAKLLFAGTEGDQTVASQRRKSAPPAGIEAFVKYWEMNDFLFMIVIENLKPYGESAEKYAAENESTASKVWFVGTSNEFRHNVGNWYQRTFGTAKRSAAFSMTRRLTLIVFGHVSGFGGTTIRWFCWRWCF